MTRFLLALALAFSVFLAGTTGAAAQGRTHLALIVPHSKETPFWKSFSEFASAAARDLGIRLEVQYANFDRARYLALFTALTRKTQDKPDAILVRNQQGLAPDLLKIAKATDTNVFFISAGLRDRETAVLGGPRKQFKTWLGELLPDHEQAGYFIGRALIKDALDRAGGNAVPKLLVAGLSGTSSDPASQGRTKGLRRSVAEFAQAKLIAVRSGGWVRQEAREKTAALLSQYPRINLFWAANDDMALGAIDALKAAGRKPGRDSLIGGLNWRPEALDAIRAGDLAFSLGGHFMEGGWAVVLLHDYFKGRDFVDLGVTFKGSWGLISRGNIARYYDPVSNEDWDRIDFKRFSRALNPTLKRYDFSLANVLQDF